MRAMARLATSRCLLVLDVNEYALLSANQLPKIMALSTPIITMLTRSSISVMPLWRLWVARVTACTRRS